jgi:putative membrane protein
MSALDDLRFDFWNAQALREAERTVLASEASLVVFVVVAGLLGLVVISMIAYVVSFSGYRLTRHSHGTLHVSRGLFTTLQVTIEQRRLHGVTVSESLLLRFVKGGKLSAIATGLGAGDEDDGGAMLVPPAPISEVRRVGALVAGNEEAVTGPLEAHGPAARRRRIARALSSAVVAAAAALLLWMYGEISLVLALVTIAALGVAGLALGVDRYRNLGSAVKDGRFIVSRGSLLRRRDVVADDGVIGWVVQASFFQRRAGLVTLNAATAAGSQHYGALDVPAARALALVAATNPGLLDPFVRGVGVPQQPS